MKIPPKQVGNPFNWGHWETLKYDSHSESRPNYYRLLPSQLAKIRKELPKIPFFQDIGFNDSQPYKLYSSKYLSIAKVSNEKKLQILSKCQNIKCLQLKWGYDRQSIEEKRISSYKILKKICKNNKNLQEITIKKHMDLEICLNFCRFAKNATIFLNNDSSYRYTLPERIPMNNKNSLPKIKSLHYKSIFIRLSYFEKYQPEWHVELAKQLYRVQAKQQRSIELDFHFVGYPENTYYTAAHIPSSPNLLKELTTSSKFPSKFNLKLFVEKININEGNVKALLNNINYLAISERQPTRHQGIITDYTMRNDCQKQYDKILMIQFQNSIKDWQWLEECKGIKVLDISTNIFDSQILQDIKSSIETLILWIPRYESFYKLFDHYASCLKDLKSFSWIDNNRWSMDKKFTIKSTLKLSSIIKNISTIEASIDSFNPFMILIDQNTTIQELNLTIRSAQGTNIEYIQSIFKLPSLKKLKLTMKARLGLENLQLSKSSSIEDLTIHFEGSTSHLGYKKFWNQLLGLQNLKRVKIWAAKLYETMDKEIQMKKGQFMLECINGWNIRQDSKLESFQLITDEFFPGDQFQQIKLRVRDFFEKSKQLIELFILFQKFGNEKIFCTKKEIEYPKRWDIMRSRMIQ